MTDASGTDARGTAHLRIALVDDQPLFRSGLAMLIGSQDDLDVVGEAGDGEAAVRLAAETSPDVVVMDVRMPVLDGIQATERILAAATRGSRRLPRILVLTTFDLDEAAARALAAGASGFVLKDSDPELLLGAIRTVHAGSAVVSSSATMRLFEGLARTGMSAAPPAEYGALTEREREIFLLAARGLSNTEIATREYVSEATVKTHVSRVLAKLGVRDRVQLVVYAFEHGLVSPGDAAGGRTA